jgi:hypothetical protein
MPVAATALAGPPQPRWIRFQLRPTLLSDQAAVPPAAESTAYHVVGKTGWGGSRTSASRVRAVGWHAGPRGAHSLACPMTTGTPNCHSRCLPSRRQLMQQQKITALRYRNSSTVASASGGLGPPMQAGVWASASGVQPADRCRLGIRALRPQNDGPRVTRVCDRRLLPGRRAQHHRRCYRLCNVMHVGQCGVTANRGSER